MSNTARTESELDCAKKKKKKKLLGALIQTSGKAGIKGTIRRSRKKRLGRRKPKKIGETRRTQRGGLGNEEWTVVLGKWGAGGNEEGQ